MYFTTFDPFGRDFQRQFDRLARYASRQAAVLPLDVVRRTSGDERDQARAHLVSLFDLLPPNDPRVKKARSSLSALLF